MAKETAKGYITFQCHKCKQESPADKCLTWNKKFYQCLNSACKEKYCVECQLPEEIHKNATCDQTHNFVSFVPNAKDGINMEMMLQVFFLIFFVGFLAVVCFFFVYFNFFWFYSYYITKEKQ